jgi:hypothetical protein
MKVRSVLRAIYVTAGMLQIVAIFCAFEKPAYAYVDPGSSYLLLQVLGSMLAGAAFVVRHRLRRMLGLAVDGASTSAGQSSTPITEQK